MTSFSARPADKSGNKLSKNSASKESLWCKDHLKYRSFHDVLQAAFAKDSSFGASVCQIQTFYHFLQFVNVTKLIKFFYNLYLLYYLIPDD